MCKFKEKTNVLIPQGILGWGWTGINCGGSVKTGKVMDWTHEAHRSLCRTSEAPGQAGGSQLF